MTNIQKYYNMELTPEKLYGFFNQCGFDVNNTRNIFNIHDFVYRYLFYLVGVPQVLLNLFVVAVVVYGWNSCKYRKPAKHYVFCYIINLAFTDLAGFCLMISAVTLSSNNYSDKFYQEELSLFSDSTSVCKTITALLAYSYINSLMATIFLTLERYFYVTRVFDYMKFVNNKTVLGSIALSWLLPFFSAALTFTSNYKHNEMCIPSHTNTRYGTFGIAVILLSVFLALLFLYVGILVKFWRIKRKNEKRKQNESTQCSPKINGADTTKRHHKVSLGAKSLSGASEDDDASEEIRPADVPFGGIPMQENQISNSTQQSTRLDTIQEENDPEHPRVDPQLQKKTHTYFGLLTFNEIETPKWISKLRPFLAASKYVIAIMVVFILCWLFWIIEYFGDVLYHVSGGYEEIIRHKCKINHTSDWSDPINKTNIPELQLCIYGFIAQSGNSNITNDNPGMRHCKSVNFTSEDESIICADVYMHIHTTLMFYYVRMAKFGSFLNALFNPIIYIQFSSEFRSLVFKIFKKAKVNFSRYNSRK